LQPRSSFGVWSGLCSSFVLGAGRRGTDSSSSSFVLRLFFGPTLNVSPLLVKPAWASRGQVFFLRRNPYLEGFPRPAFRRLASHFSKDFFFAGPGLVGSPLTVGQYVWCLCAAAEAYPRNPTSLSARCRPATSPDCPSGDTALFLFPAIPFRSLFCGPLSYCQKGGYAPPSSYQSVHLLGTPGGSSVVAQFPNLDFPLSACRLSPFSFCRLDATSDGGCLFVSGSGLPPRVFVLTFFLLLDRGDSHF